MGARGPKPGMRLSIEPLVAELERAAIASEFLTAAQANALSNGRQRGYIPFDKADDIACAVLRTHPIVIWGDEYVRVVLHDMHQTDDTEEIAA